MGEDKELSFEEKIKQLEAVVLELESGKLNLDESVKMFEKGIKLSKECNEMLQNAEKKINILITKEDGLVEEPFVQE